jgi:V8-like Glu-specific endopeptidase
MFGESATRESPEFYLKGIHSDVSFVGYRPEWADVLYTPRVMPDVQPSMRRINGQFLRPAFIFEPDNRQPFKPSSWPWHCVGKIFTSEGKTGSGALVGHNMVVTASHMIPSNAWLGIPGWWIKFVPAYYVGSSLLGIGVQSYVSQVNGWNVGWQVTGYDWAILKLKDPLGDWLGWFAVNDYSSDWEGEPWWTIVGYPGDVAGGVAPSWQTGISIFDDEATPYGGRELEHKGDVTAGNSGGPMFGWWKGNPRLIGVVSGGEYENTFFGLTAGNVTAGGSGFTSLVAWGNSNW